MKINKLSTLLSSKHQDKGFLQRGKTFTFRFLCADMYDCWLLKRKIQKTDSRRAMNRTPWVIWACASACTCDRTPLLTRPDISATNVQWNCITYWKKQKQTKILVCSYSHLIIRTAVYVGSKNVDDLRKKDNRHYQIKMRWKWLLENMVFRCWSIHGYSKNYFIWKLWQLELKISW